MKCMGNASQDVWHEQFLDVGGGQVSFFLHAAFFFEGVTCERMWSPAPCPGCGLPLMHHQWCSWRVFEIPGCGEIFHSCMHLSST